MFIRHFTGLLQLRLISLVTLYRNMTVRTVWLALALLLVINLAEGSKPSDEASDLVEELVPPNDSRSKPVQAFVFPAWFGKMSGGGDKRNPGMYSFGLGKRSSKNIGPYSFGLGKRTLPSYSFGLGKRYTLNARQSKRL